MRSFLLSLAVALFLGLSFGSSEVFSQSGRLKKFIERFDTNGDGKLSAEERAAAKKLIQKFRPNGGNLLQKPIPQTLFPGKTDLYQFEEGPHELVITETYELEDSKRNKTISLRITSPQTSGNYPLIIWCHGALGSKDGNQPLVKFWASHGYVIIQPTFGDSLTLMTKEEIRKAGSISGLVNSSHVFSQWDKRPKDVSFIVDSLKKIEKDIENLKGKIDHETLAVAGHSFGAHTTMMISGLKLQNPLTKESVSLADPRFQAAMMISPQGYDKSITKDSFDAITLPTLVITGDNDGSPVKGRESNKGEWRKSVYTDSPPGDKYLLWVKDAYHGFGGINGSGRTPNSGPTAVDQVSIVKTTGLAFFDAYLKKNDSAKSWLTSLELRKTTNGLGKISNR